MARDPANRYGSAAALANDVEHWLADQPFAQRHGDGLGHGLAGDRGEFTGKRVGFPGLDAEGHGRAFLEALSG
jgi:hypothetical protein